MIYLLDTNVISDLARKQPSVQRRMKEAAAGADVLTCVISPGEILQGIERLPVGHKHETLREQVQIILSALPCEPVPTSAALVYARIKTERQAADRPMDANDLWVAATALALGATLISRDKDLADISGLSLADWNA